VKGGSTSSTITLTSINSYNSSVSLSVSGCPAGATCSFSPTGVTPTGTSVLSIVTGTAAAGSYTLTVQGTAGPLSHTTNVGLTIQPPPDFSISANPTSVTVVQGGSGGSSVTLTALNGYSQNVGLTVSGCPSGATCTLSPTSLKPSGTSALSISGGTAGVGPYTLTIQGTDGTLTHSTTVGLTVQVPVAIQLNPASITVRKGSAGTTTVTVTQPSGSSAVTLSIPNLPSGVTATFSPALIVNGTSTLTLSTKPNTSRSDYVLTVRGSNSSATGSADLKLTVQ